MKKLFLTAGFFAAVSFTYAQKMDAAKVPQSVRNAFAKQYTSPGAVKWEKEDGNYEAGFKQGGKNMSAIYTPAGELKESETSIPVAELPVQVVSYVKEHYKGKTIKEGAKITKADGTVNYEAEISGKDIVFDGNGKFLREEKD